MAERAQDSPADAPRSGRFWRELWVRLAAQGLLIVGTVFVGYELLERALLKDASEDLLHGLHILRGTGTSFLLATWAFWNIRKARLESDAQIEIDMRLLEARVRERTRELEGARAFTELLFDSLRERIVVVDSAGSVVKANRVAESSFGGPLAGKARASLVDDGARVWEVETIALPGEERPLVLEVGHDVTEHRNLEAQVRHQEKMASLGLLAAGFAHDLGNPLASLSTELELLEGEQSVEAFRESTDTLRKHVDRMSRTLREMVDFARRRRDEITDVHIASAVADSARLVRHDPRWKKVKLELDVPQELPPVRMVEDHLVLVLVNLMLNAADAMPDGGSLSITGRTREDGDVEVRLRDTGAGMNADTLARATTPLFTTKGRGTGLGLSVCDRVIRSVGGTLELASEPGKGTVVTLVLPAERGATERHG
jgi:signal transduction histidine kinase